MMNSFSLQFPPQPGTVGVSQLDLEVGCAQVGRSRLQRQVRCSAGSQSPSRDGAVTLGAREGARQAWWGASDAGFHLLLLMPENR